MTLLAVAVIVQGLSQLEGKAKVVPPPEYWVMFSWKTWPTVALAVTSVELVRLLDESVPVQTIGSDLADTVKLADVERVPRAVTTGAEPLPEGVAAV
jgi:hypothetical protein